MTILRDQMIAMYLEVDPSFKPAWQVFVEEWSGEDLPYYLVLSDLAHHLITKMEEGNTEKFRHVFQLIDRWCLEGERYVQEAAIVGLLEGLQNEGRYKSSCPADFEPWLLSESKFWWNKVRRFWEAGEVIVDDRRV